MITEPAHAKINLTLDVLGTLPGGYHEVKSVMQALELHDVLQISRGDAGITISGNGKSIPLGPDNLVYRAAALLLEHTGLKRAVHIHIIKRIPVAAGLGGGSADAAAALVGLNRFWELGLPSGELMELGAKIGADVPFFITGKTALATGKGEKLFPLPAPPPMGVVLVKPGFGVSTARVYKLFDRLSHVSGPYTDHMIAALKRGEAGEIASCLGNALEPVTAELHPQIREIKEELKQAGALGVEMSGSGPTVFGLVKDPEEALDLARRLKGGDREVIATRFHC